MEGGGTHPLALLEAKVGGRPMGLHNFLTFTLTHIIIVANLSSSLSSHELD